MFKITDPTSISLTLTYVIKIAIVNDLHQVLIVARYSVKKLLIKNL